MNAEIKAQWIDALRSGKYTQGQNSLREVINGQTTHCCLGVLCELAVEAGVVKKVDDQTYDNGATITSFDGDIAYLPASVQRWAEIDSVSGRFPGAPHYTETLTGLNDSGYSFDEIANVIESKF